jgi:hypothetical protein
MIGILLDLGRIEQLNELHVQRACLCAGEPSIFVERRRLRPTLQFAQASDNTPGAMLKMNTNNTCSAAGTRHELSSSFAYFSFVAMYYDRVISYICLIGANNCKNVEGTVREMKRERGRAPMTNEKSEATKSTLKTNYTLDNTHTHTHTHTHTPNNSTNAR